MSGNLAPTLTAGVFQLDVVLADDGGTETATHSNVARDEVSQAQTLHFIETALANGVGEILDPYVTLGVKP